MKFSVLFSLKSKKGMIKKNTLLYFKCLMKKLVSSQEQTFFGNSNLLSQQQRSESFVTLTGQNFIKTLACHFSTYSSILLNKAR